MADGPKFYAVTRSKTEICLPAPEKYSIKTVCGKQIRNKVEAFAREGRFKNMKTCSACVARLATEYGTQV